MRSPITLVVAVAAFALSAAPAAAQHGGGGHGGGGHRSGGHAGQGHRSGGHASGGTHGGTHASGGDHRTPAPPVVHHAVPHTSVATPPVDHHTTVVVPSHRSHVGSVGALGLGLGAYVHPYSYSRYSYGYPGYYGSSSGYYGSSRGSYGHARLRILDAPRDAQVFVDGYYAGIVNDFDGRLQHLELAPGVHQIEIRARGFAPIVFDINAIDGRTISYRAHLLPSRP